MQLNSNYKITSSSSLNLDIFAEKTILEFPFDVST